MRRAALQRRRSRVPSVVRTAELEVRLRRERLHVRDHPPQGGAQRFLLALGHSPDHRGPHGSGQRSNPSGQPRSGGRQEHAQRAAVPIVWCRSHQSTPRKALGEPRGRRSGHALPAGDLPQRGPGQLPGSVHEPELLGRESQRPRAPLHRELDAALRGGNQQAYVFLLPQHLLRQLIAARLDRQAFGPARNKSRQTPFCYNVAMPEVQLPFWSRATGPLRRHAARFPFERALVMAVAAVVGLYGGIAAGLFATAIRSVQLVMFRGDEVASSLFGGGHVAWRQSFRTHLEAAHWHLEFAAMAALVLAAAFALGMLGKRVPLFEARRLRAVALAAALGLGLYYPLVLLQTFNGTFHETQGGLFALLQQAPRWTWVVAPALGALLAALIVRAVPESGGHGVV